MEIALRVWKVMLCKMLALESWRMCVNYDDEAVGKHSHYIVGIVWDGLK